MKPVVHYNPTQFDVIEPGRSASIYGGVEDHPRLGRLPGLVWTSRVVAMSSNGEFETANTLYKPRESQNVEKVKDSMIDPTDV